MTGQADLYQIGKQNNIQLGVIAKQMYFNQWLDELYKLMGVPFYC